MGHPLEASEEQGLRLQREGRKDKVGLDLEWGTRSQVWCGW